MDCAAIVKLYLAKIFWEHWVNGRHAVFHSFGETIGILCLLVAIDVKQCEVHE